MTSSSASWLPPGPRLPRSMQTLGFIFAPVTFVEACHRRYGNTVRFRTMFASRLVFVFDPDLVRQLFADSSGGLRAGEAGALLRPAVRAVFGDRSVAVLDGAEHMRQRRLLLPPFHGERMRAHRDVMSEATDRVIDCWPVGQRFELLPSMQALTLDVIMRAVFGIDTGPRRQELARRVRRMLGPNGGALQRRAATVTRGRYGRTARRRFEQRCRSVDEMIYEEIARRRAADDLAQRHDVLSILLTARDESGGEMTNRELRDQLVTLLAAGHETTATALAWAFDLLLRNPRVLERLRRALAAGQDDYLDAVVKETLRLRPVLALVGRVVRECPLELGGYRLPPGTEVNASIAAIHRRADLHPDPRAFRPERFLGADPPDTCTWIPFGGGTKRCLGASFATLEMAVVIRRVLERTSLVRSAARAERGVHQGIFFKPRRGVRVVQPHPPRPASVAGRQQPVVGAMSGEPHRR